MLPKYKEAVIPENPFPEKYYGTDRESTNHAAYNLAIDDFTGANPEGLWIPIKGGE